MNNHFNICKILPSSLHLLLPVTYRNDFYIINILETTGITVLFDDDHASRQLRYQVFHVVQL